MEAARVNRMILLSDTAVPPEGNEEFEYANLKSSPPSSPTDFESLFGYTQDEIGRDSTKDPLAVLSGTDTSPRISTCFTVKKENEAILRDLDSEFSSDVEVKEETWHQNCTSESPSNSQTGRAQQRLQKRTTTYKNDVHVCTICDMQFDRREAFHQHNWEQHSVKNFYCDFEGCYKSFEQLEEFRKHRARHSLKCPTYRCDYCHKKFFYANRLRWHINREHLNYNENGHGVEKGENRKFKCDYCSRMFSLKRYLARHIIFKHTSASRRYAPDEHWEKHAESNMSYRRLVYFEKHRMQHVTENSTKTVTGWEQEQHTSLYDCKHCSEKFFTNYGLRKHVRTEHPERVKARHTAASYQCDYCKQTMTAKQSLREHINSKHLKCFSGQHSKNRGSLKYQYSRWGANQLLNCDFPKCRRTFVQLEHLENHKAEHPAGYTPRKTRSSARKCDHCDQVMPTKTSLIQHVNTKHRHKNDTFECSFCDYRAVRKQTLQQHVVRKHGDPKYECDYCKKMFPLKEDISRHIGQHNSDAQICSICCTEYKNPLALKRHYLRLHPGKLFRCDRAGCRMLFIHLSDFEKHKAKHLSKSRNAQLNSTKKSRQSTPKSAESFATAKPPSLEVKQESEAVSTNLGNQFLVDVKVEKET